MTRYATEKTSKGADMPLRSLLTSGALVAAGLLLTSAGMADTKIETWEMQRTAGQERVRLQWSEPCAAQIAEFPSARQVVVRLPGASLQNADAVSRSLTGDGLIESARLQPVTMTDGQDGVQMTLSLKTWTDASLVTSPQMLIVNVDTPSEPVSSANRPVITLGNDDIDALLGGSYGSASAPSTGAGQSETGDVFASFYVPPDLSQEEKAAQMSGGDIGLQNTMDLFDRTVNLDYKDAELENVMRSMAAKLGLNIVMMPGDVTGRVTVSLNNVRLGDAFDSMLRANDLAYKVERGGIVRIVDRALVQPSNIETVTQSFSLNWIDASTIVGILTPFLTDGTGQLSFHQQTNTVIIEDVPEKVEIIQGLITRLDLPEKQVEMEVRLVDMTERAFRSLGLQTSFVNTQAKSFLPIEDGVVGDTPELIPDVVGTIGGLKDAGDGLDITNQGSLSFLGSEYNIESRLTALETHSEAVVLANPRVVTLNNVPAEIEVKRQIPYLDATNTTQGSVSTIRFQDVGTRIQITPKITNHGYVIKQISTEQTIQVGTAFGTPVIDERLADTTIIAKDEQTVVLGGLREFQTQNSEDGVPWFMRVPVFGQLFKTSEDQQTKVELALFVTPHIVKDPEPDSYNMALYEKIDYNWDLPDHFFDQVRMRKAPNETIDPRSKVK